MCISTTGHPRWASSGSMPGSAAPPLTSFTSVAPASSAAAATSARDVSTEMGTCAVVSRRRSSATSGTTRRISSSAETGAAPGAVLAPPMSSTSAPSRASRSACAAAAGSAPSSPPSEKESGVALRMPITRVRSRQRQAPLGSGVVRTRAPPSYCGDRLRVSSSCATVRWCTGCSSVGRISFRGSRTNPRSAMRGCGTTRCSPSWICASS